MVRSLMVTKHTYKKELIVEQDTEKVRKRRTEFILQTEKKISEERKKKEKVKENNIERVPKNINFQHPSRASLLHISKVRNVEFENIKETLSNMSYDQFVKANGDINSIVEKNRISEKTSKNVLEYRKCIEEMRKSKHT